MFSIPETTLKMHYLLAFVCAGTGLALAIVGALAQRWGWFLTEYAVCTRGGGVAALVTGLLWVAMTAGRMFLEYGAVLPRRAEGAR